MEILCARFIGIKKDTSINISSCSLPTHSATLSSTPMPERLYRVTEKKNAILSSQVQSGAPVAHEMLIKYSPLRTHIK